MRLATAITTGPRISTPRGKRLVALDAPLLPVLDSALLSQPDRAVVLAAIATDHRIGTLRVEDGAALHTSMLIAPGIIVPPPSMALSEYRLHVVSGLNPRHTSRHSYRLCQ